MLGHRLQAPPGPALLRLHPGDVAVAWAGQTFDTLLGSCVAVLLTDPRRSIGAMCHVVHARGHLAADDLRFAVPALRALGADLRARGYEPRLCEARLFGGGNMFPDRYLHGHVGKDNVDAVAALLRDQGIAVVDTDVGGHCYRRVTWTVGEGEPRVQRTPMDSAASAAPLEMEP
jgi:chemotaxis protein CheD